MISRENIHESNDAVAEERTKHLHHQHLALLQESNFSENTMTATGMKGECCLNSSRFFHYTRNKVFDIFHEVLAGIGPLVLKLSLNELILQKEKFTVEYFNGKIYSFHYGFVEKKAISKFYGSYA